MNEPSVTQGVKALEQQHGETLVTLAMLRKYWARVVAVLGATLALGAIIEQGREAKAELVEIKAAQKAQVEQNEDVKERLTKLEAEWGALFGAAHINVVPNKPEPDKRKGLRK